MKLGKFNLSIVSDGTFWLDGGAMFGVVPKVLWNKTNPADAQNRIELALNCLLIQTGDKNILVDTGIGDKNDEKFKEIYRIEGEKLPKAMEKLGITPDDIDIVINTHLHFDHCGGNTRIEIKNEEIIPTFPNAEYIIQKREWEDAMNPNERTRASYLKENLLPIKNSGLLRLIEGDMEIVPGVKTFVTKGHTFAHQSVLIESDNKKAFYLGDLIPTSSHIKIPYIMGYDLYPLDIMETKKKILERALKEHWLLIFEHDPKIIMGYLEEKEGRTLLNPVEYKHGG